MDDGRGDVGSKCADGGRERRCQDVEGDRGGDLDLARPGARDERGLEVLDCGDERCPCLLVGRAGEDFVADEDDYDVGGRVVGRDVLLDP